MVGGGLDIIYPPENYDLYRTIAEKGAVVSEFPFGRRADKQTFPIRNRVVAGLCEALIVVDKPAGLPVHAIHGNNRGDAQAMHYQSRMSGGLLQYHGAEARLELAGRRIIVTHYDHLGYALACTGDWDLACCGHSHRAEARPVPNVKGGSTWLVNPGTVAGLSGPATWVLADLAEMRFEVHTIPL